MLNGLPGSLVERGTRPPPPLLMRSAPSSTLAVARPTFGFVMFCGGPHGHSLHRRPERKPPSCARCGAAVPLAYLLLLPSNLLLFLPSLNHSLVFQTIFLKWAKFGLRRRETGLCLAHRSLTTFGLALLSFVIGFGRYAYLVPSPYVRMSSTKYTSNSNSS